ncbi:MAG: hypothetical protein WCG87_07365 [Bacteroidota bacterium]
MSIFQYAQHPKIIGYHGTSIDNRESILENNFNESKNDEWYGDAVYFFVDGVNANPPHQYAAEYAID